MQPDPALIQDFADAAAFGGWLAGHHAASQVLWLKIWKQGSGVATISIRDAVTEALRFGWIDGQKAALDDRAWLTRFTPRKARSLWSQVNRELAEDLIAAGRMEVAGLAQVVAARADGRWDAAYARQSDMEVPEDFQRAVASDPAVKEFYDSLNRANLFAITYRLNTARKPETRGKRAAAILAQLAKGQRFH